IHSVQLASSFYSLLPCFLFFFLSPHPPHSPLLPYTTLFRSLGLFDPVTMGPVLEEKYGIPQRKLTGRMSPWAVKRLDEFGGDISDRKSTRLNSSHVKISYAVFCVKKNKGSGNTLRT